MRNQRGFSLMALAAMAPMAMANGGNEDLDKVYVPALQGVTVKAKAGSGVTFDMGDDFMMNISGRLQVQWRFSELDLPTGSTAQPSIHTFRVRRARTKFKGHMFSPDTTYVIYLEHATGGTPLDVYIQQRYKMNEEWTLDARAGAMKTLYGREATGTSVGLEFVERSLAARTFSDTRATGLLAQIHGMENKLHFHVGAFNADTAGGALGASAPGQLNNDNELSYTFGIRYDFQQDMGDTSYTQGDLDRSQEWNGSIHGNVWIGNENPDPTTSPDGDIMAFNVGGALKGNGVHALAEFFWNSAELDAAGATDHTTTGWNAQASYVFENHWGVGARISMVDIDTVDPGAIQYIFPTSGGATGGGTAFAGEGDVTEISVGVNKFFNGHKRKVQADVTFQSVDPQTGSSNDNIIFRVMATLAL